MDRLEPMQGVRRKSSEAEVDVSPRPEKVQVLEHEDQGKASLETMPPEVIERVGLHLLRNPDLRSGNKDDTSFMRVSRYIHNSLRGARPDDNTDASSSEFIGGPPTLKLRRISNRFTKAAQETFEDIVPVDGFEEEASYEEPRGQRRHLRRATHDIIDAVGPMLHYQTNQSHFDLVSQVCSIENKDVKGEAINSLTKFASSLSYAEIDFTADDAMGLFAYPAPSDVTHRANMAMKALVRLSNQNLLSEDHAKRFDRLMSWDEQFVPRVAWAFSRVTAEDSGLASQSAVLHAEPGLPAIERLQQLEHQRRAVVKTDEYDEHAHLDITETISRELPALENRAREELLNSVRERSGRAD